MLHYSKEKRKKNTSLTYVHFKEANKLMFFLFFCSCWTDANAKRNRILSNICLIALHSLYETLQKERKEQT